MIMSIDISVVRIFASINVGNVNGDKYKANLADEEMTYP